MAVYAAMIDNMDQNIGRLVAKLKSLGVEDNTIILFASDNGSNPIIVDSGDGEIGNIDRWASLGGDWANVSNTPLRHFKDDSFQGGISTPLIINWPQGIRLPGTISDFTGHFIDIMPTLLEVSGADYPSSFHGEHIFPYEGVSLLPVIQSSKLSEKPKHLAFQQRSKPLFWQWGLGRAVRDGPWKIVASGRYSITEGDEWHLYDMGKDKSEITNLADDHPEIVAELAARYDQWWQELPDSRDGDFKDFMARIAFWVITLFEKTTP